MGIRRKAEKKYASISFEGLCGQSRSAVITRVLNSQRFSPSSGKGFRKRCGVLYCYDGLRRRRRNFDAFGHSEQHVKACFLRYDCCCNLEPLTERECFHEDLRQEIIEFQQFVSSKPFPSLETCIRNLKPAPAAWNVTEVTRSMRHC